MQRLLATSSQANAGLNVIGWLSHFRQLIGSYFKKLGGAMTRTQCPFPWQLAGSSQQATALPTILSKAKIVLIKTKMTSLKDC